MARRWGTQALKQDREVRGAHGVKAHIRFASGGSNPNVSISLECAPGRVVRIPSALPQLSSGTPSGKEFRESQKCNPLRYSGEHFRPSRVSPAFNSRRRVFILRGTFFEGFACWPPRHFTIKSRRAEAAEIMPVRKGSQHPAAYPIKP